MSDNMRICDRCGSAVPAGAATCPNCGAPLGGLSADDEQAEYVVTDDLGSLATRPAPSQSPKHASSQPGMAQVGAAPPRVTPAAPIQPPQKRNRWLWILVGCLILALILCVTIIFLAGYLVYSFG